jgi:uncharacterized protein YaaW (UPF0174 family)
MSFSIDTRKVLGRVPADRLAPIYERHDIAPSQGPKALLDEICLDGSNTIASMLRGWEGVRYEEIVGDVAEQLGLAPGEKKPREIELQILEFIIQKYLANATPEERENLSDVLKQAGADFNRMGAEIRNGVLTAGTLALLIRAVGQKVVAEAVGKVFLRIVSRQAAREAGKRAAAIAGFAIPLLNVVMIGWTVIDIAGPAFRKTVPTVIEIALLRMEHGEES